jgi:hypothetical protein
MGANDPIGLTSRPGSAENHGQRQLEPGRDLYVLDIFPPSLRPASAL